MFQFGNENCLQKKTVLNIPILIFQKYTEKHLKSKVMKIQRIGKKSESLTYCAILEKPKIDLPLSGPAQDLLHWAPTLNPQSVKEQVMLKLMSCSLET